MVRCSRMRAGTGRTVGRSEEYRHNATRCREMAQRAFSLLDKEAWLQLATDWLTLTAVRDRGDDGSDAQERDRGTGPSDRL
jgi:hypothetical protein